MNCHSCYKPISYPLSTENTEFLKKFFPENYDLAELRSTTEVYGGEQFSDALGRLMIDEPDRVHDLLKLVKPAFYSKVCEHCGNQTKENFVNGDFWKIHAKLLDRLNERVVVEVSRVSGIGLEHARQLLKEGNGDTTNGSSKQQRKKLEKLGMMKYFTHLFISEEIGTAKPDLEFFRYFLEQTNSSVEEAIVVGDSYENDIQPCIVLGIRCIWINHKNEDRENNELVIEVASPEEAIAALREWT